ncbi:Uncharacterised protein r2_g3577 [Pycnogonum litorale]
MHTKQLSSRTSARFMEPRIQTSRFFKTSIKDFVDSILRNVGGCDHQCPICGRILQQSRNLKRHMIAKHGSRRYYCDICLKTFSRTDALRRHTILFH